jgi:hypothetical protein
MKKDLLDILKDLCTIENQIREYFGYFEHLGRSISDLSEIILEQYGKKIDDDIVFEQIMNFGDGNITKKQLLKHLK